MRIIYVSTLTNTLAIKKRVYTMDIKKIIYHRNEQIENFSYNESPTGYGKEAQGSSR